MEDMTGFRRSIPRFLDIPPEETIHAVIGLGYPQESYARIPGRKKCTIRHLSKAG